MRAAMQPCSAVPLGPHTTLGVGGPARFWVEARDVEGLRAALDWATRASQPVALLGGGSNLLVADEGFPGLVVAIALRGVEVERDGVDALVTAAAGEPWDALVARTVEDGLAGLECLSGIPGCVGATPIQNVGAYGREVGEVITRVRVLDRPSRTLRDLVPADCAFGYRDSRLKREDAGRYVVLSVTYRLRVGGAPSARYPELDRRLAAAGIATPSLADVRAAVLAVRRQKSMLFDPSDPNARSCGSFFVNPVVSPATAAAVADRLPPGAPPMPRYALPDGRVKLAAAWLIEQAGLARGARDGCGGRSDHHTLAIVARPGATARDVVRFAWRVRGAVSDRFGIELVPEPAAWGFGRLVDGLPVLDD